MPRVTAEHGQGVRDRIVAAALQVFGDRGYHGATIQDVVRGSGLSVGAIYTYFRGKDDLFLATCDLAAGRGFGELAARLARGRTVADKLAIAISFYFDAADGDAANPGNADFLVQAWGRAEAEPAVREMLERRRLQLVAAATLLAEEGVVRGELPRWVDVKRLARACTVLLDGFLLVRAEEGPRYTRDQAEPDARELIAALVAASSSPTRPPLREVQRRSFSLLGRSSEAPN
ncbi:MAG TPA: TetR/AcrR family transcriptional regulator [Candidatus Limnocylindrales bacterium]|nr:TetR/AcrR family transcriptional regulator [Candidatus Limnocylindrales bacterium]